MEIDFNSLLGQSEFFALLAKNLSEERCQALIKMMEIIELDAGKTLYQKGSISDGMYVLLKGLAYSTVPIDGEEKMIGIMKPGQTLGELGMISSQRRPANVKTLRQSVFVKLSQEIFNTFFINEPQILLKLLDVLVSRGIKNLNALENIEYYRKILFMPANEQVNAEAFFTQLLPIFQNQESIKFLNADDYENVNVDLMDAFQEAEKQHDYVVCYCSAKNQAVADFFLARTERIFVLADGLQPMQVSGYVDQVLRSNPGKQELVLLYPHRTVPMHATQWLNEIKFFRYHHVALNVPDDCARLVRFMTGTAFGVVLSGGGTKGWVHAGVLMALKDANIPIDFIGGTSVGAVIGAKYLLANDYEKFYAGMKQYAETNEKPFSVMNFTFPIVSVLDGRKLTKATSDLFGDVCIENLWKPFFCISCDIGRAQETVHSHGPLSVWIRASTALPGIVPPLTYQGTAYVDGGVINNLPVDVMRDFFDGTGKVLAVDLSSFDDQSKYSFPPVLKFVEAFLIKFGLKSTHYQFMSLGEIMMRSRLIGSAEKAQRNGLQADILIRPDLSGYKLLTETKRAGELFEVGYQAMWAKLDQLKALFK